MVFSGEVKSAPRPFQKQSTLVVITSEVVLLSIPPTAVQSLSVRGEVVVQGSNPACLSPYGLLLMGLVSVLFWGLDIWTTSWGQNTLFKDTQCSIIIHIHLGGLGTSVN